MNLLAKNYIKFSQDKNFFTQNLKKNIFYFGKEHLRTLNVVNIASSKKVKFENYLSNYNNIQKFFLPKIPFDGNFLKQRGVKEGTTMGKILKLLENDWVNNDFQISDKRIEKIIDDENN